MARYCSHGPRPPWEQHRASGGAVPPLPAVELGVAGITGRWRTGGEAPLGTITVPNVDTVPVAVGENTRLWAARNAKLGLDGRRPSELCWWEPPLTFCSRRGSGQAERVHCCWHLPEIRDEPFLGCEHTSGIVQGTSWRAGARRGSLALRFALSCPWQSCGPQTTLPARTGQRVTLHQPAPDKTVWLSAGF